MRIKPDVTNPSSIKAISVVSATGKKKQLITAAILFLFFGLLAALFGPDANANNLPTEKSCDRIQAAVNKLPAEGGEVSIPAGTYVCTKPIVLDKNRVKLRGAGPATLLKLADGANAPVIVMGTTENVPSKTVKHLVISDLMIDGNRANQQSECMGGPCSDQFPLRNNGISIRRCDMCKVESVTVFGAMSGGLVTELGSRNLVIRDYTAFDNQFDGLAGYETEDSTFTGITLYNNLAAGISTDIQFNNNKFFDVTINDSKSVGIFMRDSLDNSFTNLHIRNSAQHGIYIAQVDTDPTKAATGNTFSSVVITGSGGMGILVNDASCVNNMMVGTQFVSNKEGCFSEAHSGLVENVGVICR
jgi:polygalacturonase